MYSDRYNYYTIQSDLEFSQYLDTNKITDSILDTGFFVQKDVQTFVNNENIPFINLFICKTKEGNYNSSSEIPNEINLISIVFSKDKKINPKIYIDILLSISKKIGWKLFLEEDEDENEFV